MKYMDKAATSVFVFLSKVVCEVEAKSLVYLKLVRQTEMVEMMRLNVTLQKFVVAFFLVQFCTYLSKSFDCFY
jgi:hypothetical protein